jgi:hypothetical protein
MIKYSQKEDLVRTNKAGGHQLIARPLVSPQSPWWEGLRIFQMYIAIVPLWCCKVDRCRWWATTQPNDRSSTRPRPRCSKKRKNLLIPSASSSPPHRLATATPSVPSRTWMPLCLAATAPPIWRRSLAPSRALLAPSCRALVLVVLSLCPSRRPPGRAKTSASAQWRWCSRATARCGLWPWLLESTDSGLPFPYVAYVYFNCFRHFRYILQLFHFDVAK